MSPANTMARVYTALKEQVLSGAVTPGDRLDPAKIAADLAASITPVREALYRLTGERVVESWQNEGFRVPLVSEAMLRDLYAWSLELVTVVIRGARKARGGHIEHGAQSGPADFGHILVEIAMQSPNHEHRAALASLNDRSAMFRRAEQVVIADVEDIDRLANAIAERSWGQVQVLMTRYFRRRLRAVVAIAALLPTRHTV